MNSMYGSFASVYDPFMEDVDYSGWKKFIVTKLRENGIRDGLVCELGCGTGTMTELLASAGYDMIGIDSSVDMLEAAQEKKIWSRICGISSSMERCARSSVSVTA